MGQCNPPPWLSSVHLGMDSPEVAPPACQPPAQQSQAAPSSRTLLPSGPQSALLSRNSSPQADPSSRNTTPTLKTPLQMSACKSFPWGLSRLPTACAPAESALPISRLVTFAKALQAASPLDACPPKNLICLVPVCLPSFSPAWP